MKYILCFVYHLGFSFCFVLFLIFMCWWVVLLVVYDSFCFELVCILCFSSDCSFSFTICVCELSQLIIRLFTFNCTNTILIRSSWMLYPNNACFAQCPVLVLLSWSGNTFTGCLDSNWMFEFFINMFVVIQFILCLF